MLPTKLRIIWPSGFRGEGFLEINQSETRIVYDAHVCKQIKMEWAITIDASYHVTVHLAKLFQSRRFLEIDQSETRIAYEGHIC
jgi:hypothetical protein